MYAGRIKENTRDFIQLFSWSLSIAKEKDLKIKFLNMQLFLGPCRLTANPAAHQVFLFLKK